MLHQNDELLVVDRFEGNLVVLEFAGFTCNVPRAAFPKDLKEGDVVRIAIDHQATEARRRRLRKALDRLLNPPE